MHKIEGMAVLMGGFTHMLLKIKHVKQLLESSSSSFTYVIQIEIEVTNYDQWLRCYYFLKILKESTEFIQK